MALNLVAVGQKITVTLMNLIISTVNTQGTSAITPGSVSSVPASTASISGTQVNVSGASTVIVDGLPTTYRYLRVTFEEFSTTGLAHSVVMQLRVAGVAYAGTTYTGQTTVCNGAISCTSIAATSGWTVASQAGGQKTIDVDLYKVSAPYPKQMRSTSIETNGTLTNSTKLEGQCSGSGVIDGIMFTISSGVVNGNVNVYGWN